MSTQFLEALVSRNSLRPRVQQTQGCVGKYVGAINILYHCWGATGCIRELFYSELQESILHHLNGWSASLSSEDFVIWSLYMVGRSERTAAPTICFISESSRHRKEARDIIKESGILKSHPDFKTAHMSKDPGWGGELEQLASDHYAQTMRTFPPIREVFYEKSRAMDRHGFSVHVKHATSTRQATATAVKVRGQLYYFTVCHVFFDSPRNSADATEVSAESDEEFEIDSDGDATDDDELFSSMTSIASHSSGSHSKDSSSLEEERESNSSSSSFARSVTPTVQAVDLPATLVERETVNELYPSLLIGPNRGLLSPAPSTFDLDLGSLVPLGHLLHWSIDQDWALIAPSDPSIDLNASIFSKDRLMLAPPDEARVLVRTARAAWIDGRLSGTPSYIRVPTGSKFQKVHALRLEEGLTEGDCGAAVFGQGTEKLLGHIMAGCRSSGFAYVVAAEDVILEVDKAVEQYQKTSKGTSTGPTFGSSIAAASIGSGPVGASVGAANETRRETNDPPKAMIQKPSTKLGGSKPGTSPADLVELEELCARVHTKLKDHITNSEPQLDAFVREIANFHKCITELRDLCKEYGQPLPFPMSDFAKTLERCERVLDDGQNWNSIVKVIRPRFQKLEIDNLRKQVAGHYQALHMCISFVQLRLHLEATRQTQRLMEPLVPLGTATSDLSRPGRVLSPAAPPQSAAKVLYKDWEIFDRWLKAEDARLTDREDLNPTAQEPTGDVTSNAGDLTAAALDRLRQEVEDAMNIEENRAKRVALGNRSHLAPSEAMRQQARNLPTVPERARPQDYEQATSVPRHEHHNTQDLPTPQYMESPESDPWRSFQSLHRAPSISTTYSSVNTSLDSRSLMSRMSISTAATDIESLRSSRESIISSPSLTGIDIGPGALEWRALCRKVCVERTSSLRVESKSCDLHWRYREDGGMTIRSAFRSTTDGKARLFTTQHFPSLGPSIPQVTSHLDGQVSIDFPKGSYGTLDKGYTDIKYTLSDTESSIKLQTLLYTNGGKDDAELVYDRPIMTISTNLNKPECRARNLRLWRRNGIDHGNYVDGVQILFYTNALRGDKSHWVEEPNIAFEPLLSNLPPSDRLTLVFRKDTVPTKSRIPGWIRAVRQTTSSIAKGSPSTANISFQDFDATSTDPWPPTSSHSSLTSIFGSSSMNRFGYSEIEIKFRSQADRNDFVHVWRRYTDTLGWDL